MVSLLISMRRIDKVGTLHATLTQSISRRLKRTLRHFLLALAGLVISFVGALTVTEKWDVQAISLGTAYASLIYVALSLSLGPMNVIRSRPLPVSYMLRRDVGIWAGIFALVHVIAGLNVHLGGKFWLYFVYDAASAKAFPIRYDPFGFANHSGLVITLMIIVLLTISNNAALRRLRSTRWKSIQRWNYGVGAILVFHGLLYQFLEKRYWQAVLFLLAISVGTLLMQYVGFRRRRQNNAQITNSIR